MSENFRRTGVLVCSFVVLSFLATARPVSAQQSIGTNDGWRATLVATTKLPTGSNVAVSRRSSTVPRQLILVGPQAASDDITVAVGTLGLLRARDGDTSPKDVQALPPAALHRGPGFSAESERMRPLLQTLRGAAERDIPGLGTVRAVDIDVGPRPQIVR